MQGEQQGSNYSSGGSADKREQNDKIFSRAFRVLARLCNILLAVCAESWVSAESTRVRHFADGRER